MLQNLAEGVKLCNFQFLHSHNSNQYLITCVLPLETLFKKEEQIRCCFI